jgi:hypothetical protein
VIVDLSNCSGLHSTALQLLIRKNAQIEELQLSGCNNAVDDTAFRLISGLKNLTFLDVSFAKRLTDKGCNHFAGLTT